MTSTRLPLRPLLRSYLADDPPPSSARTRAILTARTSWLREDFLTQADDHTLRTTLLAFYTAISPLPWHQESLARRVRLVRHGLNHLLHGADPLPTRLERCLGPDGTYAVAGLGLSFWATVVQATDPDRLPGWTPATERGLVRLGLLKPVGRSGQSYARMIQAYDAIRAVEPALPALRIDDFLTRVAAMNGRELVRPRSAAEAVAALVRQVRTRQPLRKRLTHHLPARREVHARLTNAIAARDAGTIRDILHGLGPRQDGIHDDALTDWVGQLWSAADPLPVLAEYLQGASLLGGGPGLAVAVLHLRDPGRFPAWDDASRSGLAALDDGYAPADLSTDGYRLFIEACDQLRQTFRLHPLEVPDVLAEATAADEVSEPNRFRGFASDTFRFLAELADHNDRAWMDGHRDRYRFVVREPLVELCQALADRYVEPVLNRQFGWDLETEATPGRALSRLVRNDHGRSVPYESALWITFYRRVRGAKRDDVQLFVRLDARGLAAGLNLGRRARDAGRLFRRNVQEHAEALYQALAATDARSRCRFLADDGHPVSIDSPADLRAWAAGKALVVERLIPPDDPLLRGDDLVGEVLLTFDRLLPAYRCAVDPDPARFLGGPSPAPPFDADRFCQATFLPAAWLQTATALLALKRQLILQGVPGTGKTHVAWNLARLLTNGADDRIRLVQFHPGYAYEEFVEGIKPRTVTVGDRPEVTYPVEDGVLCQFAAQAAARPAEAFVLLIDEVNRGNLPRVFGELLYLLEYRDREVTLPYSRRPFRLPANLYVIGTMNAADRSVAVVDQALRRRFSFLDMPPDARVLASWLTDHPPADESLAPQVISLFESLNRKLAADLGTGCQVGHTFFMVPGLTADRLRVVWDHHVRPVLAEYFAAHPQRLSGYDPDALLKPGRGRAHRTAG